MDSQQVDTSNGKSPQERTSLLSRGVDAPATDRMSKVSVAPAAADQSKQEERQTVKTPTGLGAEPLNIVILGASFGGLSCAHHFLDYTINNLHTTSTAPNYRLVIVSPSTHIYWNIGAPRALVAPDLIKHEDAFIPIEPGFHRHRGHQFTIIQGTCTSWDTKARTVNVELIGTTAQKRCSQVNKRNSRLMSDSPSRPTSEAFETAKVQTIPYHALICATGSSADSELLSLHGPHFNTVGALNAMHAKVAQARSIVICGGGCSGVETAGQLATFLNYEGHWPLPRQRIKDPKKIILLTGSDRCLPRLTPKMGRKAEAQLVKLGVDVRHGVRATDVQESFDLTGQTKIELDDNTSMIVDLYMACTGVKPNSAYAPAELRDESGYIANNKETMRVDAAGPRVFAVGDVASYSQNYVLDVYAAVPALMHNLLNDLLANELRLASPYGGNQADIEALEDEKYAQRHVDSQLCPITRFGGVGMLMDSVIPKAMVHLLKGHDYRVCKAKMVTVNGGNPYAIKTAIGNKYE